MGNVSTKEGEEKIGVVNFAPPMQGMQQFQIDPTVPMPEYITDLKMGKHLQNQEAAAVPVPPVLPQQQQAPVQQQPVAQVPPAQVPQQPMAPVQAPTQAHPSMQMNNVQPVAPQNVAPAPHVAQPMQPQQQAPVNPQQTAGMFGAATQPSNITQQ